MLASSLHPQRESRWLRFLRPSACFILHTMAEPLERWGIGRGSRRWFADFQSSPSPTSWHIRGAALQASSCLQLHGDS
jgi:hypothetical protein